MSNFIKSLGLTALVAATILVCQVHSSSFSLPRKGGSEVGRITGRILNPQGLPIVNAKVIALKGGPTVTPPQADSDRNGDFQIENLEPGVYTVYGHKEDEGYFDRVFNFYSYGPIDNPTVTVSANQTTPNVIVQLEKGAFLKGRVIDRVTGKLLALPRTNPAIWLRQAEDPKRFLNLGAANGEFQVVVPSLPITVEVTMPGYEDWHYTTPESGNRDGLLLLAPESTEELQILMTPRKSKK
jgi:hypothetical protein